MLHSQSTIPEAPEQVELFVGFRKLQNVSHLQSLKIKLYVDQVGNYVYFGETEAAQHDSHDFSKTFVLSYLFESNQKLRFDIVSSSNFNQENLLGQVFTTLGNIVGTRNQIAKNGLDIIMNQHIIGKLIIRFEKVTVSSTTASMVFQAQISNDGGWFNYFDIFGLFSSKNPVLKLYRITNDDDYAPIYESNVVENSLNPVWDKFDIKVSKLCNNDYYRPIKAAVFSRKGYEDSLIGEAQFTLDEVMNQEIRQFTLLNHQSQKQIGQLSLTHCSLYDRADFLDYLKGGTQLNVIVGIDFTASNGDPDVVDSLHALKFDGTLNEYQKAIQSVCSILLDYDYDKRVLMYGFGGKPAFPHYKSSGVQHCFPLNGDVNNPWVFGLDGIMNTYSYALNNVILSGPTLFAPILHEAMKVAQKNKAEGSSEYTILLLITDGEIHDMEATINCLIKSAQLPLSVIIVGVGSADFGNMNILDGDEGLYNAQGVKAERDLVQFVPFRDFQMSSEKLAQHVLEEIPEQLVEYMSSVGIKPNPPPQFDISMISSQPPVHYPAFDQPSIPLNDEQKQYLHLGRSQRNEGMNIEEHFAPTYHHQLSFETYGNTP